MMAACAGIYAPTRSASRPRKTETIVRKRGTAPASWSSSSDLQPRELWRKRQLARYTAESILFH